MFGVERGCSSEHAKTLAEQMQRQAGARLLARGNPAQHRVLVQFVIFDQTQMRVAVRVGIVVVSLGGLGMPADRSETGLKPGHEARYQVGTVRAQGPQGLHVSGLQGGVAGLF